MAWSLCDWEWSIPPPCHLVPPGLLASTCLETGHDAAVCDRLGTAKCQCRDLQPASGEFSVHRLLESLLQTQAPSQTLNLVTLLSGLENVSVFDFDQNCS